MSLLAVSLVVAGLVLGSGPVDAVAPSPSSAETARLLGYMWGDGAYENGVWDVNGPSGTSSLIEELVEAHGGVWTNRSKLQFTLAAPYDWRAWKDGLPDDSASVRSAVTSPHFLAALMEAEASVGGQIYDQSRCCVPGYTRGRLTELRDLLRARGYSTAELVQFGNVDSGKITVASSQWDELRAQHRFVCPVSDSDIRLPGGSDYARYGDIRWFDAQTRWSDVVRNDCAEGQSVPAVGPAVGSCTATTDGTGARIDWTFTLGDAVIRRDGSYLTTVSGRDGTWTDHPTNGTYSYEVRLLAFGQRATEQCGSVAVGVPVDGPCSVEGVAGGVRVSWDDFGKSRYAVRRNGSWVANVTNGATSLTLGVGSPADAWAVRYRQNGSTVTIPCAAGEPPIDGPCTVGAIAGGVRIDWNDVAGIDRYQVRRNGAWLATVDGASRYDHVGGALGSTYLVRYRQNGESISISCI